MLSILLFIGVTSVCIAPIILMTYFLIDGIKNHNTFPTMYQDLEIPRFRDTEVDNALALECRIRLYKHISTQQLN